MSLLKKLFGGSTPDAPEPITHEGFLIFPDAMAEGKHYRLSARVEKEVNGELKVHQLIRADTFASADAANDAAVRKAKQLIDQLGDRLF